LGLKGDPLFLFLGWNETTMWFIIIVCVSVAYNFQTKYNKIKLLTARVSVSQNVLLYK
jgi:hypothetical protein